VKQGVVPQTLWTYQDVVHTQEAKEELIEFVDFEESANVLNSVKPSRLIEKMLTIGTKSDAGDLVLDYFAGSGSTAHAVIAKNAKDRGNRRFILVQLPEPLPKPEKNVKTIADLAKSRIRRVSVKLQKDNVSDVSATQVEIPDVVEGNFMPECGFKVMRLDRSNFRLWNSNVSKEGHEVQSELELHVNHIDKSRSQEDILYEILLKSGFSLTSKIEKENIEGKTVYSVAEGALLICLEKELTLEVLKAIADKEPSRVVCLDEGFKGNDQLKTNAVQIMKSKKITSFRTV
jgi:adenine-specific DNA-methyltransferase